MDRTLIATVQKLGTGSMRSQDEARKELVEQLGREHDCRRISLTTWNVVLRALCTLLKTAVESVPVPSTAHDMSSGDGAGDNDVVSATFQAKASTISEKTQKRRRQNATSAAASDIAASMGAKIDSDVKPLNPLAANRMNAKCQQLAICLRKAAGYATTVHNAAVASDVISVNSDDDSNNSNSSHHSSKEKESARRIEQSTLNEIVYTTSSLLSEPIHPLYPTICVDYAKTLDTILALDWCRYSIRDNEWDILMNACKVTLLRSSSSSSSSSFSSSLSMSASSSIGRSTVIVPSENPLMACVLESITIPGVSTAAPSSSSSSSSLTSDSNQSKTPEGRIKSVLDLVNKYYKLHRRETACHAPLAGAVCNILYSHAPNHLGLLQEFTLKFGNYASEFIGSRTPALRRNVICALRILVSLFGTPQSPSSLSADSASQPPASPTNVVTMMRTIWVRLRAELESDHTGSSIISANVVDLDKLLRPSGSTSTTVKQRLLDIERANPLTAQDIDVWLLYELAADVMLWIVNASRVGLWTSFGANGDDSGSAESHDDAARKRVHSGDADDAVSSTPTNESEAAKRRRLGAGVGGGAGGASSDNGSVLHVSTVPASVTASSVSHMSTVASSQLQPIVRHQVFSASSVSTSGTLSAMITHPHSTRFACLAAYFLDVHSQNCSIDFIKTLLDDVMVLMSGYSSSADGTNKTATTPPVESVRWAAIALSVAARRILLDNQSPSFTALALTADSIWTTALNLAKKHLTSMTTARGEMSSLMAILALSDSNHLKSVLSDSVRRHFADKIGQTKYMSTLSSSATMSSSQQQQPQQQQLPSLSQSLHGSQSAVLPSATPAMNSTASPSSLSSLLATAVIIRLHIVNDTRSVNSISLGSTLAWFHSLICQLASTACSAPSLGRSVFDVALVLCGFSPLESYRPLHPVIDTELYRCDRVLNGMSSLLKLLVTGKSTSASVDSTECKLRSSYNVSLKPSFDTLLSAVNMLATVAKHCASTTSALSTCYPGFAVPISHSPTSAASPHSRRLSFSSTFSVNHGLGLSLGDGTDSGHKSDSKNDSPSSASEAVAIMSSMLARHLLLVAQQHPLANLAVDDFTKTSNAIIDGMNAAIDWFMNEQDRTPIDTLMLSGALTSAGPGPLFTSSSSSSSASISSEHRHSTVTSAIDDTRKQLQSDITKVDGALITLCDYLMDTLACANGPSNEMTGGRRSVLRASVSTSINTTPFIHEQSFSHRVQSAAAGVFSTVLAIRSQVDTTDGDIINTFDSLVEALYSFNTRAVPIFASVFDVLSHEHSLLAVIGSNTASKLLQWNFAALVLQPDIIPSMPIESGLFALDVALESCAELSSECQSTYVRLLSWYIVTWTAGLLPVSACTHLAQHLGRIVKLLTGPSVASSSSSSKVYSALCAQFKKNQCDGPLKTLSRMALSANTHGQLRYSALESICDALCDILADVFNTAAASSSSEVLSQIIGLVSQLATVASDAAGQKMSQELVFTSVDGLCRLATHNELLLPRCLDALMVISQIDSFQYICSLALQSIANHFKFPTTATLLEVHLPGLLHAHLDRLSAAIQQPQNTIDPWANFSWDLFGYDAFSAFVVAHRDALICALVRPRGDNGHNFVGCLPQLLEPLGVSSIADLFNSSSTLHSVLAVLFAESRNQLRPANARKAREMFDVLMTREVYEGDSDELNQAIKSSLDSVMVLLLLGIDNSIFDNSDFAKVCRHCGGASAIIDSVLATAYTGLRQDANNCGLDGGWILPYGVDAIAYAIYTSIHGGGSQAHSQQQQAQLLLHVLGEKLSDTRLLQRLLQKLYEQAVDAVLIHTKRRYLRLALLLLAIAPQHVLTSDQYIVTATLAAVNEFIGTTDDRLFADVAAIALYIIGVNMNENSLAKHQRSIIRLISTIISATASSNCNSPSPSSVLRARSRAEVVGALILYSTANALPRDAVISTLYPFVSGVPFDDAISAILDNQFGSSVVPNGLAQWHISSWPISTVALERLPALAASKHPERFAIFLNYNVLSNEVLRSMITSTEKLDSGDGYGHCLETQYVKKVMYECLVALGNVTAMDVSTTRSIYRLLAELHDMSGISLHTSKHDTAETELMIKQKATDSASNQLTEEEQVQLGPADVEGNLLNTILECLHQRYMGLNVANSDNISRVKLLGVTVSALRTILATSLGKASYEQLGESVQDDLKSFIGNQRRNNRASAMANFDDAAIDGYINSMRGSWSTSALGDAGEWLSKAATSLLLLPSSDSTPQRSAESEGDIAGALRSILAVDSDTARILLPKLVHRYLVSLPSQITFSSAAVGSASCKDIISSELTRVLQEFSDDNQDSATAVSTPSSPLSSLKAFSARTVIDIITYVRRHAHERSLSPNFYDGWLDVNYGQVAQAALKLGDAQTALFFAELWIDYERDSSILLGSSSEPSGRRSTSRSQTSSRGNTPASGTNSTAANTSPVTAAPRLIDIGADKLQLLRKIYTGLSDPDAFYSVDVPLDPESLLSKFTHEQNWEADMQLREAIRHSAAELNELGQVAAGRSSVSVSEILSMMRLGMDSAARTYFASGQHWADSTFANPISVVSGGDTGTGNSKGNDNGNGLQFEAAWRLQLWDASISSSSSSSSSVDSHIFSSLKRVHSTMRFTPDLSQQLASSIQQLSKLATSTSDTVSSPRSHRNSLPASLGVLGLGDLTDLVEHIDSLCKLATVVPDTDAAATVMNSTDDSMRTCKQMFANVGNVLDRWERTQPVSSSATSQAGGLDVDEIYSLLNLRSIALEQLLHIADPIHRQLEQQTLTVTNNAGSHFDSLPAVATSYLHKSIKVIRGHLVDIRLAHSGFALENGHLQVAANTLYAAKAHTASRIAAIPNSMLAISSEETVRRDLKQFERACQLVTGEARMFWQRGERHIATRMVNDLNDQLSTLLNAFDGSNANMLGRDEGASIFAAKNEFWSMAQLHAAKARVQLGLWVAHTKSERPAEIISSYLVPATEMLERSSKMAHGAGIYCDAAAYADEQYGDGTKSEEENMLRELISHKADELQACGTILATVTNPHGSTAKVLQRQQQRLESQLAQDRKELRETVSARREYLMTAVRLYLRGLGASSNPEQQRKCLFRAMALWLAHPTSDALTDIVEQGTLPTASIRFLPLAYQLCARLNSGPPKFEAVLRRLVTQMCKDHPFHISPMLFTLSSQGSAAQAQMRRNSSNNMSLKIEFESDVKRGNVALDIVRIVVNEANHLHGRIVNLRDMHAAYVTLAMFKIDPKNRPNPSQPLQFPSDSKFVAMQNSGVTPIITLDITPDPLCKYEASSAPGGLVYIASVEPSFKVVHGINMPKVVKMLGSDGVRHTQLVKSNDDLRQDAVIEQLFGLANSLLSESRATRSRSLRIRTYKVVPLTRQTGVLQWVDNTQPIGEYLQSAHARFYPKDLQVQEARRMIATELSRTNSTPESKLAVYNRVTSRLHPVMRFFFLENFPAPDDWYVRRLTYSRSVAVSSVIGHILGIGDRHAQNILIDNRTAEVVHIDLGIAFDNGKLLPTPELVPFRLTRDVVDGMGISGVEGVFRKCCEETLARLRECAQVVVTILDVLKFDPLYQWTLSPTKSRKVRMRGDVDAEDAADALAMLDGGGEDGDAALIAEMRNRGGRSARSSTGRTLVQTDSDQILQQGIQQGLQQQMQMQMQESNREAERALVNIQRKLAADLSVQSQVNDLIVMASSPSILARMYHGWQPYL